MHITINCDKFLECVCSGILSSNNIFENSNNDSNECPTIGNKFIIIKFHMYSLFYQALPFWVYFVYGIKKQVQFHSFSCPNFPTPCTEECLFPIVYPCLLCHRIIGHMSMGWFLGFVSLIYVFIYVSAAYAFDYYSFIV